jgi:phospholipid/cholesterol/gamma-HCH transport system substrate-binding protein
MIRFADQIVGAFIILALGILVFVIFMLGSSQRWFSRDYNFVSYFNSASGISQNMAVQYKGFTIGHVKSIRLDETDRVEVRFTIFDTYIDRVRHGSIVEVLVSPIGLGNQFIFYPGLGDDLIPEGELIPAANSREGKRLMALGLVERPEEEDSITAIMQRAGMLVGTLNDIFIEVLEALQGTSRTTLGRTMLEVELTLSGVRSITERLPDEIEDNIDRLMAQVEPLLASIVVLTESFADPDGAVMAILDTEGEIYISIAASLDAVSGVLRNLERTSDFIPAQMPQLAAIIADLHTTLLTAEDVLVALTNNPILRRGVPERIETRTGGVNLRDMEF